MPLNKKVKTRNNLDIVENIVATDEDAEESTTASAFKGLFNTKTWRIRNASDPLTLIVKYHSDMLRFMIQLLTEKGPSKLNIVMEITMVKSNKKNTMKKSGYFHSGSKTVLRSSQLPGIIQESADKISNTFDIFLKNGSGWQSDSINYLCLFTAMYEPVRGKSYIPIWNP